MFPQINNFSSVVNIMHSEKLQINIIVRVLKPKGECVQSRELITVKK